MGRTIKNAAHEHGRGGGRAEVRRIDASGCKPGSQRRCQRWPRQSGVTAHLHHACCRSLYRITRSTHVAGAGRHDLQRVLTCATSYLCWIPLSARQYAILSQGVFFAHRYSQLASGLPRPLNEEICKSAGDEQRVRRRQGDSLVGNCGAPAQSTRYGVQPADRQTGGFRCGL